jgi:hypothetical protein
MLTISFSLKNSGENKKKRFFSFEAEKSGEIISVLDKFLSSRRIEPSALDFFHIQLLEDYHQLDKHIVQAIIKGKKAAIFLNPKIKRPIHLLK